MPFKVFISYSSHDLKQVEQLQTQLAGSPVEVFVAETSVQPSQELPTVITKAIENCDLFVVLWSKNAQESSWVSQEIGQARALEKQILPLVLNEGLSLPGFIQSLKYVAVYKDPAASFSQARDVVVEAYEKKAQLEASQAQAEKDKLALLAIGALLFWLFK